MKIYLGTLPIDYDEFISLGLTGFFQEQHPHLGLIDMTVLNGTIFTDATLRYLFSKVMSLQDNEVV